MTQPQFITFSIIRRENYKTDKFRISRNLSTTSLETLIKSSFGSKSGSFVLRDADGYVLPLDALALPSNETFYLEETPPKAELNCFTSNGKKEEQKRVLKTKATENKANRKSIASDDKDLDISSFIITGDDAPKQNNGKVKTPKKNNSPQTKEKTREKHLDENIGNFMCPVCERYSTKPCGVIYNYQVEYHKGKVNIGDKFCKNCYQASYDKLIKKRKRPQTEEKLIAKEDEKKMAAIKQSKKKRKGSICNHCGEISEYHVAISHDYQLAYFASLKLNDKICKKCFNKCYNHAKRKGNKTNETVSNLDGTMDGSAQDNEETEFEREEEILDDI